MLSPGYRIGDHALVRRAATGATSDVYEARHLESGARAAVKVLHTGCCLDRDAVMRFFNEALALQHIKHPHIVKVFDYGALPEGPPFIVLEWLPVDLHRALSRAGGGFSPGVAAHVASQLADALGTLHAHGLVHRDLKPANVLLSQEDPDVAEIKLADLGLAKLLSSEAAVAQAGDAPASFAALPISTGGSVLLGTWEYMAPEQWVQSKSVDPRADVYSLGVLLFQMLAGRLPFVAEQQKDWMYFHVIEAPPLELLADCAPAGMRDLVARMMSKKASSRPTMHEVVMMLAEKRFIQMA
ncbi:serine/threonine-protein kinase [Sorangium sp. So ce291]|uniref:serine/threonine-protein kinase n=1 Tax=Sorangium sp. So ce291 TaxID=3133294 RepID=UPI003F647E46